VQEHAINVQPTAQGKEKGKEEVIIDLADSDDSSLEEISPEAFRPPGSKDRDQAGF
jgi:hypothetical protein